MSPRVESVLPPPKPLAYVLGYQNPEVIEKFRQHFDVSEEEAQQLFTDVKQFLWVVAVGRSRPSPPEMDIVSPLVDEMWHTFILFTKEHHRFCNDCFGRYMHHSPHVEGPFKEHRAAPLEELDAAIVERRRGMYQLVYDELGEETLLRWFRDYRARYTLKHLNSITIPINQRRTS